VKIQKVKVNVLKAAEYNPRKWTEEEEKNLKDSIKKFGQVDPLVVNKAKGRENVVIGGHFRLAVAKKMGHKEIYVTYVNIPDIKKEKELNIRLNKNTGEWDFDLLKKFEESALKDIGFVDLELGEIFFDASAFKRPDLGKGDVADGDSGGKTVGNERYFYVEYYDEKDKKLFEKLQKALGKNLKGLHEINKDYFKKLVLGK